MFHLRGNQRTSGERSKREGGKVFGSGSRTPVAITLMVKNPEAVGQGGIHFHDIGDYLTRKEKLSIVTRFDSVGGITATGRWEAIAPDEYGDWLSQRNKSFDAFMAMGDKDTKGATALFVNFSRGVATARDAWCYNASRDAVASNMRAMIDFYNAELNKFNTTYPNRDRKAHDATVDHFINTDQTKISWNRGLKDELTKGKFLDFDETCLPPSIYHPFTRQYLYFNRSLNDMIYQMPRIFPMGNVETENQVISVPGLGGNKSFSALMIDTIPDLNLAPRMGGYQCFPEYLYDAGVEI